MDKFPETPRGIIIKAEVLREGVRATSALSKVGEWALSTASHLVLNIPDVTEEVDGAGMVRYPHQFSLKEEDITIDILFNQKSPYEIKEEDGSYFLYRQGEVLEEVSFIKRPEYFFKTTRDGTPVNTLVLQRGPSCITVCPFNFCEYSKKGEPCLYCCVWRAWDNAEREYGAKRFPKTENMVEAVVMAHEEINIRELKLSGGALYNTHKEAHLYLRAIEAILKATGDLEEITLVPQALDEDDQKRLKDAGVTNVMQDMEVWDEGLWPVVVPGKLKAVGRDKWLERLVKSVEIFGKGRAASNIVAGIEMVPAQGFKTTEEAIASNLEAFEWMLRHDIVPFFTFWSVLPGSQFKRGDVPSVEYFLTLGEGLHKLMLKYDMYPSVGFKELGQPPATLNLFCWYCYSMSICRDYPRLTKPVRIAS
jgi:hypothetical protein